MKKDNIIIIVLVIIVIAGMSIWLKPWEKMAFTRDQKYEKIAKNMAGSLSDYYKKKGAFPWNYSVGAYVPDQRRPESAFAYQPASLYRGEGEALNRDWLTGFLDVSSLSDQDKDYWRKNDEMYVLKQVSSGNKVVVCFIPNSEDYRKNAAAVCAEDGLGRRDTSYQVGDFDPCARVDGVMTEKSAVEQNLTCVSADI